jgi:hypothetical protein
MMQYVRPYALRIAIGIVVAASLYESIAIWIPYQREQRIARQLRSYGHTVEFADFGPNWIPLSIRDRLPLFHRIRLVRLVTDPKTAVELMLELRSLPNLAVLELRRMMIHYSISPTWHSSAIFISTKQKSLEQV